MTWIASLLALLPLISSAPTAVAAEGDGSGTIEIVVRGMHNDEGRMMALLYDGPKGFPRNLDLCIDYRTAAISNGRARTSFSKLEPGTYAVLVIHDEDRDGYLATNLLGMPKEGVGVSNNGKGIPKFDRAKFEVAADGSVTKSIDINYL